MPWLPRCATPGSKWLGLQEDRDWGPETQPGWMLMSSCLASNRPEFESWLRPSVILKQWSRPLGLSFPFPKQTGCSGCQVWGLLGERLLSQESSLIHGCVWWNSSWAMSPGVGRGRNWVEGQLSSLQPPRGDVPGYSFPSMPCCCWLSRGHGCRSNSLILFPLAAEHSASRCTCLEVGTVSRHLDCLTWHRDSLSGSWLAAGICGGMALLSCGCPKDKGESISEPLWPLGTSLDSQ